MCDGNLASTSSLPVLDRNHAALRDFNLPEHISSAIVADVSSKVFIAIKA